MLNNLSPIVHFCGLKRLCGERRRRGRGVRFSGLVTYRGNGPFCKSRVILPQATHAHSTSRSPSRGDTRHTTIALDPRAACTAHSLHQRSAFRCRLGLHPPRPPHASQSLRERAFPTSSRVVAPPRALRCSTLHAAGARARPQSHTTQPHAGPLLRSQPRPKPFPCRCPLPTFRAAGRRHTQTAHTQDRAGPPCLTGAPLAPLAQGSRLLLLALVAAERDHHVGGELLGQLELPEDGARVGRAPPLLLLGDLRHATVLHTGRAHRCDERRVSWPSTPARGRGALSSSPALPSFEGGA